MSYGEFRENLADGESEYSYLYQRYGLRRLLYGGRNPFDEDPKECAYRLVWEQVLECFRLGEIGDNACYYISQEKASSLLYWYSNQIGIGKPPRNEDFPAMDNEVSMDTNFLRNKILQKIFTIYYSDLAKRSDGIVKDYFEENGVYYDVSKWTEENQKEAVKYRVDKALNELSESKVQLPNIRFSSDFPPLFELIKAIDSIEKLGEDVVSPILPFPDISPDEAIIHLKARGGKQNWTPDIICSQFSEQRMKQYIEEFFIIFLCEYRKIIESNFPGIKELFNFYMENPNRLYVEYHQNDTPASFKYVFYRKEGDEEFLPEVIMNPRVSSISRFYGMGAVHRTSKASLLCPNIFTNFRKGVYAEKVERMNRVRSWVIGTVVDELDKIDLHALI